MNDYVVWTAFGVVFAIAAMVIGGQVRLWAFRRSEQRRNGADVRRTKGVR